MITLHRNDIEALAFLARHGVYPDRGLFEGLVAVRDGQIIGAAGIDRHDIQPGGQVWNATVHSAGEGYWTRYTLTCFYTWLFAERGLRRLTAECAASNLRSRAGMRFSGWKEEGVRRCGAPDGGDIITLGLLAEECRFIERPSDMKEAA